MWEGSDLLVVAPGAVVPAAVVSSAAVVTAGVVAEVMPK